MDLNTLLSMFISFIGLIPQRFIIALLFYKTHRFTKYLVASIAWSFSFIGTS